MRRDYVSPDDFDYEPTPHDEVLARMQAHRATEEAATPSREEGAR
jgi:NADH-quinone oxidoreductase subunit C